MTFRHFAECGSLVLCLLHSGAQAEDPKPSDTNVTTTKPPATAADRKETEESLAGRRWCQLVNVCIPPASPFRNSTKITHPPNQYVVLRQNGRVLPTRLAETSWSTWAKGSLSTVHHGWEIDFEDDPQNQWPIQAGDARYTIELWDSNWGQDDLILSISGLKAEQFQTTVCEKGSPGMSTDRLVKFEFRLVDGNAQSEHLSTTK